MADEAGEDLPEAGGAKGPSPLIPVLAIVIILPVINFMMTQFMLIPGMKSALAETIQESGVMAEGEKGGGESSAPSAAESSEEGIAEPASYEFDGIIANLAGSMRSRYVKVSFMVEGSDPEFTATMEKNRTKLIDAAIGVLAALTIKDLEDAGIKNVIRNDLIGSFEAALRKRIVESLYFSEFVVQ